jgi:hypothetical protein
METEKPAQKSGPGYETSDANPRSLVLFGLAMFVTIGLVLLITAGVFKYFSASQSLGAPASPFANASQIPPAPRLQTEPKLDLEHLRAREDHLLHTYEWVDSNAGIVRIPIERAMDLVLQKGLPVRQQAKEEKTPVVDAVKK